MVILRQPRALRFLLPLQYRAQDGGILRWSSALPVLLWTIVVAVEVTMHCGSRVVAREETMWAKPAGEDTVQHQRNMSLEGIRMYTFAWAFSRIQCCNTALRAENLERGRETESERPSWFIARTRANKRQLLGALNSLFSCFTRAVFHCICGVCVYLYI